MTINNNTCDVKSTSTLRGQSTFNVVGKELIIGLTIGSKEWLKIILLYILETPIYLILLIVVLGLRGPSSDNQQQQQQHQRVLWSRSCVCVCVLRDWSIIFLFAFCDVVACGAVWCATTKKKTTYPIIPTNVKGCGWIWRGMRRGEEGDALDVNDVIIKRAHCALDSSHFIYLYIWDIDTQIHSYRKAKKITYCGRKQVSKRPGTPLYL